MVTFPAESTLASVNMRKKLTSLPERRADSSGTCACPGFLAFTGLTCLGKPKCLYLKKSWSDYDLVQTIKKGHPARQVTFLAEPTFCFSSKWFVKFSYKSRFDTISSCEIAQKFCSLLVQSASKQDKHFG